MKMNIPEWFQGEIYEEGATVSNRFTGETCDLDAEELSIYDFIMGSEAMIEMMGGYTSPQTTSMQQGMSKAVDWFKERNPGAYNILLE